MHLNGRILLLLVSLIFSTSYARYVNLSDRSLNQNRPSFILARDGDDCRAICSPQTACCRAGLARRGPKPGDLNALSPRTLQPLSGSVATDAHIIATTNSDQTIRVFGEETGDTNSAVFRQLENDPINIGIVGLCGCTALVVVNSEAVYFAHYFESLSFAANPGQAPPDFQATVINFLLNGLPTFDSLAQHAAIFNTPNTRVFIMSPSRGSTGRTFLYANLVQQMVSLVARILPSAENAVFFGYPPLNMDNGVDNTLMDTTTRGRALFEYDPNPDADGARQPQLRLFLQSKKAIEQL